MVDLRDVAGLKQADFDHAPVSQESGQAFRFAGLTEGDIILLRQTLSVLESIIADRVDHLTIFKFTTGWKMLFDTPTAMHGDYSVVNGPAELERIPGQMGLAAALDFALDQQ